MSYEPVDRLPVLALEPFEPSALDRWRREGLPEEGDPVDFLGMSRLVHVPLNFNPIPAYEPTIVGEDKDSYDQVSPMGAVVRHNRDNPEMFYGHIDHPVKTRRDWEEYRRRFEPDSPGRLPEDWPVAAARLNESKDPVGICLFPFFFRFGFYSMGMERFLTAFYDMPDVIHGMFECVSRLVMAVIEPVLSDVRIDFVQFNEDLAGKNGPLISPQTYAEFWYPYQDPVMQALRNHEVPVVCQWTSGRYQELLPGMLEHGFNCAWPSEAMAGMDAPSLRRAFGPALLLGGNIPKEAVIAGPEAIDREIDRLMPLIEEGGFLPALDDMASPDMPFAHYRHMIERLQAIRLST